MTNKQLIEQLRKQIPSFDCIPGCTDCCGPIPWSACEWEEVPVKRKPDGVGCPYITRHGCKIYEYRPILCRLFGTVERMKCPHGCRPLAMISQVQELDMMDKYIRLLKKERAEKNIEEADKNA